MKLLLFLFELSLCSPNCKTIAEEPFMALNGAFGLVKSKFKLANKLNISKKTTDRYLDYINVTNQYLESAENAISKITDDRILSYCKSLESLVTVTLGLKNILEMVMPQDLKVESKIDVLVKYGTSEMKSLSLDDVLCYMEPILISFKRECTSFSLEDNKRIISARIYVFYDAHNFIEVTCKNLKAIHNRINEILESQEVVGNSIAKKTEIENNLYFLNAVKDVVSIIEAKNDLLRGVLGVLANLKFN